MPDRRPSRHSLTEAIVVGFTGHIGAGKTCAAKYLSSRYGFQYARYSQILREWLSPGPADRDRLRTFGWEVMAGGRQVELNARLIAKLDRSRSAVIDGLRHMVDYESLSNTFGASFRLIFLDARQDVRFERLRSRFSADEALQVADAAPVEAYIDGLKPLSNTTILNEESLESLYQRLDTWLAALGTEPG